jgi:hypothetical protein
MTNSIGLIEFVRMNRTSVFVRFTYAYISQERVITTIIIVINSNNSGACDNKL